MWSFCGLEMDAKPDVRPVRGVPGLYLARNVLSDLEEAALLESISAEPVPWVRRRSRYTKNYGPYYVYKKSAKHPTGIRTTKLPTWATGFLETRLKLIFKHHIGTKKSPWCINQVHVALYRASLNNKISPHNDTSMGTLMNAVIGVSLGDPATMTFEDGERYNSKSNNNNNNSYRKKEVKLPRRSAYLMTDDALKVWKHSIKAHHNSGNRLSITCRNVISLKAPASLHANNNNNAKQQSGAPEDAPAIPQPPTTTTTTKPPQPPVVYTEHKIPQYHQDNNSSSIDNLFYPGGSNLPVAPSYDSSKNNVSHETPEVDLHSIIKVWGVSDDKVHKLRRFHNM